MLRRLKRINRRWRKPSQALGRYTKTILCPMMELCPWPMPPQLFDWRYDVVLGAQMGFSQRGTIITLLAALGLAVTAYVGLFVSGVPTIFSPFPVLTVIPALLLFRPPLDYVVVGIPALLFLLWNPQLMRQEGQIPRRTYILFALGPARAHGLHNVPAR